MVRLVGRMSLGDRLDADLGDPDTDKVNQNRITRCQSMMVNEDQHWGNWIMIRETSSMPGDSSCLQWVEKNGREVVIPDVGEGRSTRSRDLTEKGLAYKKETLRERRKINGRLIRKYSTIEDLLFSSKNVIAVEEEMKQFNDIFKMLLDAHQKYNQLLGDNERDRDDDWFDDVDTQCVPSRGRCIIGWGKLHKKPSHHSVRPKAAGVHLTREV